MQLLVSDMPIWNDCPYKVSPRYVVRRDYENGLVAVSYEPDGKVLANVSITEDALCEDSVRTACEWLDQADESAVRH